MGTRFGVPWTETNVLNIVSTVRQPYACRQRRSLRPYSPSYTCFIPTVSLGVWRGGEREPLQSRVLVCLPFNPAPLPPLPPQEDPCHYAIYTPPWLIPSVNVVPTTTAGVRCDSPLLLEFTQSVFIIGLPYHCMRTMVSFAVAKTGVGRGRKGGRCREGAKGGEGGG